jgi:hypothetical protein
VRHRVTDNTAARIAARKTVTFPLIVDTAGLVAGSGGFVAFPQ